MIFFIYLRFILFYFFILYHIIIFIARFIVFTPDFNNTFWTVFHYRDLFLVHLLQWTRLATSSTAFLLLYKNFPCHKITCYLEYLSQINTLELIEYLHLGLPRSDSPCWSNDWLYYVKWAKTIVRKITNFL